MERVIILYRLAHRIRGLLGRHPKQYEPDERQELTALYALADMFGPESRAYRECFDGMNEEH